MTALLQVENVCSAYGRTKVHRDVSMEVGEGEIIAVLGANGAGKTTLLKLIAGLMHPTVGRISFEGKNIAKLRTDQVARTGIALVPEGRRVFARLSVLNNLRLGGYGRPAKDVAEDLERMLEYFPILRAKGSQRAGELSGGQQQMLAIGRGLMARPRLLLLDEPSLGLSPKLVAEVGKIVGELPHGFGTAVLLVEQNAGLALSMAKRGYLMQTGRIVRSGDAEELRNAEILAELYLG